MAYRWNGVECDTFEELQRLQGTTSAVIKETKDKDLDSTKCKSGNALCGDWRCNYCN